MQDDLEWVAGEILRSRGMNWLTANDPTRAPAIDFARAAMAATREIDAEALREQVVPRGATYEARLGVEVAADWLQQRANDVKEAGNG